MNIGFEVEKLLCGQNPLVMPHATFKSPERNPRKILTQKVRRNTNLPDKVVITAGQTGPPPASPYFRVTMNGPYISGTGSYAQSSNTSGTWTITYVNNAGTLSVQSTSYTVSIVGDVSGLVFPLTATITPNATQPTGSFTVRQSGVANQPETVIFNSPSDLVKTIPTSGSSVGTTPVPSITKNYGSGSSGNQGNITITGSGVRTLTVAVNSVNEPTPGVAYFTVAMNGPYGFGTGTYTSSSNTTGNWTITPVIDGLNYHTSAASYTVTLTGDTSGLIFPLTATITPNVTVAGGQFIVRQSGTSGVSETITFANSGDLVKTIPPSGTSVGTTAVPDVIRQTGSGSSGSQGSITITATGVQTLTIDVVSGNEPTPVSPYFELTINTPYWTTEAPGSTGTYAKTSNTSGTWTITYGPNKGDPATGYLCAAQSYTITLLGNTASLTFPLTVTITPNATPSTIEMRVKQDQAGGVNVAETVTMSNSGDNVKTIGKPSGESCCSGSGCTIRCVPEMYYPNALPTNTGGNFTISATGVQSLVVTLTSTN
jgi:hypothetical protein